MSKRQPNGCLLMPALCNSALVLPQIMSYLYSTSSSRIKLEACSWSTNMGSCSSGGPHRITKSLPSCWKPCLRAFTAPSRPVTAEQTAGIQIACKECTHKTHRYAIHIHPTAFKPCHSMQAAGPIATVTCCRTRYASYKHVAAGVVTFQAA